MMDVYNIMVAGVGGQGVLLAGNIIAWAALLAGHDVKQSEVHGMAQRGGSVECHVRLGGKVYSPAIAVGGCDLLIGFEPLETARYVHYLKQDGTVVYNTRRVPTLSVSAGEERYPDDIVKRIAERAKNVYPFDATFVAVGAGEPRALNLALLGAATRFMPVEEEFVLGAIEKCLPARVLDANKRAFMAGRGLIPD